MDGRARGSLHDADTGDRDTVTIAARRSVRAACSPLVAAILAGLLGGACGAPDDTAAPEPAAGAADAEVRRRS